MAPVTRRAPCPVTNFSRGWMLGLPLAWLVFRGFSTAVDLFADDAGSTHTLAPTGAPVGVAGPVDVAAGPPSERCVAGSGPPRGLGRVDAHGSRRPCPSHSCADGSYDEPVDHRPSRTDTGTIPRGDRYR